MDRKVLHNIFKKNYQISISQVITKLKNVKVYIIFFEKLPNLYNRKSQDDKDDSYSKT